MKQSKTTCYSGLDIEEIDFLAREGHKVKKCSRR